MWFKYLLIALLVWSPLHTISKMGEPRQPYGKDDAIIQIIINALFIWGVVAYF